MKKKLFIILILAALIRMPFLDKFPPHLRNDEAALGYNAYSILKTGKCEHGNFLPLFFKSFGDWKPGFYVYSLIPFVSIFGLTEFTVRLPSVISGIIAIFLIHQLTKQVFKNEQLALITSFLTAISPWHIAFSRGAWTANLTITLTLAALVLFFKSLNKNQKYLLPSSFLFALTFITSHSAKASTPLIILCIAIAYWKKVVRFPKKTLLKSFLIFTFTSIPVILTFVTGKTARISGLSIFSQSLSFQETSYAIFKNWIKHFSLPSLFLKGDGNPQHTAVDFGAFYPFEFIFLFSGIISLIKSKIGKQHKIFLALWILASPISSALTKEGVNFVRYLIFFIPITILIGLGLQTFLRKRNAKQVAITLYAIFFLLFLDAYLIHNPAQSTAWQYGYKEIIQKISPQQKDYEKVFVSQGPDQPYIFFLFYQRYPPKKYQLEVKNAFVPNALSKDIGVVEKVGNAEFVNLSKFDPPNDASYLLIYPVNSKVQLDFEKENLVEIDVVNDTIGFPVFKILKHAI